MSHSNPMPAGPQPFNRYPYPEAFSEQAPNIQAIVGRLATDRVLDEAIRTGVERAGSQELYITPDVQLVSGNDAEASIPAREALDAAVNLLHETANTMQQDAYEYGHRADGMLTMGVKGWLMRKAFKKVDEEVTRKEIQERIAEINVVMNKGTGAVHRTFQGAYGGPRVGDAMNRFPAPPMRFTKRA